MRIFFLLLLLLPAASASADLYKWKDEEGNTVYGDNPPKSVKAERISPPPLTTYPGTATPQKSAATAKPVEGKDDVLYRQLSITSPGHDEAVRSNEGEVTVQVRSDPSLDTSAGHKMRFYLNGRPVGTQAGSSLTLTEVERGTHLLYVEILDGTGKSLRKSEIVQFHLLRHSSLNK